VNDPEGGASGERGEQVEPATRLARRLGTGDAVVVGLGAMLGTGVFVVFAPAAAAAGEWLLLGLLLAAAVAYANATSSAQLAAVHPRSGGTYVYGRERLGRGWGALAGYAFIAGKVASCGAAALAVGAYAWPDQQRAVAAAAVLACTGVNLLGVQRTVRVTRVLVGVLLLVLAVVVAVGLVAGNQNLILPADPAPERGGIGGVPRSAALLFFAFAGYARIATLGEEVRDPARTIPRAIPLALGITLVAYVAVALAALRALGVDGLAGSLAPLADVVRAGGAEGLVPLVRAGGAVAAFAVLFSLVAGISRTAFAMGVERDLPRWLAAVDATRKVPHHAELAVGAATLVVVLVGGLDGAVAFSAFAVLLYYAIANASALRLRAGERRWPRWLAAFGLLGCLVLAFALPLVTVVAGSAALAVAMGCDAPADPRADWSGGWPGALRVCGAMLPIVPYLRISEAAGLLGVSDDTVRRWADSGRLLVIRGENGRQVVDGAALAALAQEIAAAPEPGGVAEESARNRFRGIVTRVVRDTVMAQVELQAGPFRVVSLMSREAADQLDLQPGVVAVASVKATQVVVGLPESR